VDVVSFCFLGNSISGITVTWNMNYRKKIVLKYK